MDLFSSLNDPIRSRKDLEVWGWDVGREWERVGGKWRSGEVDERMRG